MFYEVFPVPLLYLCLLQGPLLKSALHFFSFILPRVCFPRLSSPHSLPLLCFLLVSHSCSSYHLFSPSLLCLLVLYVHILFNFLTFSSSSSFFLRYQGSFINSPSTILSPTLSNPICSFSGPPKGALHIPSPIFSLFLLLVSLPSPRRLSRPN